MREQVKGCRPSTMVSLRKTMHTKAYVNEYETSNACMGELSSYGMRWYSRLTYLNCGRSKDTSKWFVDRGPKLCLLHSSRWHLVLEARSLAKDANASQSMTKAKEEQMTNMPSMLWEHRVAQPIAFSQILSGGLVFGTGEADMRQ